MSQFGGYQLRNFELKHWKYPRELSGLVLISFQELQQRLPQDAELDGVFLLDSVPNEGNEVGYDRYARNQKTSTLRFYAAYGCHGCKKIVVGSPRIEVGWLRESYRENLSFYCRGCNALLEER